MPARKPHPLCRQCGHVTTRPTATFCSVACMGDAYASDPRRVAGARAAFAKGRAEQRAAYYRRAVQRVGADAVALLAMVDGLSAHAARVVVTKQLALIEARGYRRGFIAQAQRARRAA